MPGHHYQVLGQLRTAASVPLIEKGWEKIKTNLAHRGYMRAWQPQRAGKGRCCKPRCTTAYDDQIIGFVTFSSPILISPFAPCWAFPDG